ncbi:MAG: hypothetical protein A2383_03255 [Candidatus Pacebacteria bacterium RIFOXYB1_FULL_39_46]|nr:MAG: hypothetical protein A2182_01300 [Candidatus Pacebacteria bacterium RIFOXYA1_FULL_38_18]OGJ38435.1 MAG: hypothetical protein A2383_03255 [Candidatus Pacebacteria bacterium RIFOXYB1_FULL_39_46]OGJ40295.1 MAG: hypothetical protein A2411_03395 [Candidatus Pacebacteria bacterium RIFOXYC1_FULL_39_21]OGJ40868.1 MAG: hypothetical protein A2582_02135 [Candidatus Pacebacteria bacterium RIFOXYD1_FULL_39_27]
MIYTLALAGSTERTLQVAQTLLADKRFKLKFIITPQPKPVGRQQTLIQNPVHQFAQENQLPIILIDRKLDQKVQLKIETDFAQQSIDFLLVVDFGYLIPQWLLKLPKVAPLNIHPSLLPRWRGSSPGQFVLLSGNPKSAVTLMIMSEKMDEGAIIAQLPFTVDQTWTQTEYYSHSFDLICKQLGDLIDQFAQNKIKAVPQPTDSPTPIAKRLTKQDSFYDWSVIKQAMESGQRADKIERACRAFYPWPKLWTKVMTNQGEKRLIIHRCHLSQGEQIEQATQSKQTKQLILDQVQWEGKNITSWNEAKNSLLEE